MHNRMSLVIFQIVAALMCIHYVSAAEVHNAGTCSEQDVQAAIDDAQSGDTVMIPAGRCTWTNTIVVPTDKQLTILGAGMHAESGGTTITADFPHATLELRRSGSRVAQLGFLLRNDRGYGIAVSGKGWRIDHCYFEGSDTFTIEGVQPYGTSTSGHPVGVIDHCDFIDSRVYITGDLSFMATTIWSEELGLGTNNAVFVENCFFQRKEPADVTAIDSIFGGRYVFRYNTAIDCYILAHPCMGSGRGSRSWEIYENTIKSTASHRMWVPIFLRAGTGVVFNNTIIGSFDKAGFALDDARSCYLPTNEDDDKADGLCDGDSYWDGNTPGMSGYPCRDQIGRSTDAFKWTDWQDKTKAAPAQEHEKAYCWGNKMNEQPVGFFTHVSKQGCQPGQDHVEEGRDYVNSDSPKPGYTHFTYPHPLAQTGDTAPHKPLDVRMIKIKP